MATATTRLPQEVPALFVLRDRELMHALYFIPIRYLTDCKIKRYSNGHLIVFKQYWVFEVCRDGLESRGDWFQPFC